MKFMKGVGGVNRNVNDSGFRTQYDMRVNKKKNIFFITFIIRLVLRTVVLTQEKRMFIIAFLEKEKKKEMVGFFS